jgi:death-on-curing protein
MKVSLLTVDHVLFANEEVYKNVRQKSLCLDQGKIESALGAAFYPGQYPFQYGGIARVAGALCFFLVKAHAFLDGNKRTALLASTMLMDINGYELIYPLHENPTVSALTNVIENTAASQMKKEELIIWYDRHKRLKQSKKSRGKIAPLR